MDRGLQYNLYQPPRKIKCQVKHFVVLKLSLVISVVYHEQTYGVHISHNICRCLLQTVLVVLTSSTRTVKGPRTIILKDKS